jgi:hypothetical protein
MNSDMNSPYVTATTALDGARHPAGQILLSAETFGGNRGALSPNLGNVLADSLTVSYDW